mmetsp:Transcript_21092/g.38995  ORF Transcript_21092/g.38995 Transcript_21092/m.38995 type:complete len:458 (+) Transcript_21092:361-1734(+)
MRGVRLFSRLIGPPSSLQSLLLRIDKAASGLDLYREQQQLSQDAASHLEALRGLEPYVLTRIHELDNKNLLIVLQQFAGSGVASQELVSSVLTHATKRIHSFTVLELANAAFYISRTEDPRTFLEIVQNIVLKDPLQLDEHSAAMLTAAFGNAKTGSDELFRVLGGIFVAKSKVLKGNDAAMFCSGFSSKPWKDISIETAIDSWTQQTYAKEPIKIQVELLGALAKYNPSAHIPQRLLSQLKLQELKPAQCEKLLANIAVHCPTLPSKGLLDRAYALLEAKEYKTYELVKLIYTLHRFKQSSNHFEAINLQVQEYSSAFTAEELICVLCALVTTNRGDSATLQALADSAENLLFSAEQVVRVVTAMATVGSFIESLSIFATKLSELTQGRAVTPAEYTWGFMALSHISYSGPWDRLLDGLKWIEVESPEHYMQLYKAAERVPGSERHLEIFAGRFER